MKIYAGLYLVCSYLECKQCGAMIRSIFWITVGRHFFEGRKFRGFLGLPQKFSPKINGVVNIFQEEGYLFANPDGPLSEHMPSAAISSANNEVKDLVRCRRCIYSRTACLFLPIHEICSPRKKAPYSISLRSMLTRIYQIANMNLSIEVYSYVHTSVSDDN